MKYHYWLFYSSLDFSAGIFRSSVNTTPEDFDPDMSGSYKGPFKTLKEAKDLGVEMANEDIGQYRLMKNSIKGKPSILP